MKFRLIVKPEVHEKTKALLEIEVRKAFDGQEKGLHIKNALLDKQFQKAVAKMFGAMPRFTFKYEEIGIGEFNVVFDSMIDKIGFVKGGLAPIMANTMTNELKKELGRDFISIKQLKE